MPVLFFCIGKRAFRPAAGALWCLCIFPLASAFCQSVHSLPLEHFLPQSIYQGPEHHPSHARFEAVDFHSHDYPKNDGDVAAWVQTMDEAGIGKSIVLTYQTGRGFDSAVQRYRAYPGRFQLWCGLDYRRMDEPGWSARAVAELERCYKNGARGVGELGDKGMGELYSLPVPGYGMHVDDPRLRPVWEKCAELHMPVSVHVAEDAWMYLPSDSTNDGLMNAATWKVDMSKPGILNHDQLLQTLEHALAQNPNTIFIACHLANCCSNLEQLGKMLDHYPNLYADIAARYSEIAPIPRQAKAFMEKYEDRLVYGTDMGNSPRMYQLTFRILETADEHFYAHDYFTYHWPLYGLDLSQETLQKIYHGNAEKILGLRR